MVKKLEKGSNLASSKIQQKNHTSSNVKATKSKKNGKGLCYGCGLYGHECVMCPYKSWANKCEAAKQKASIKWANQMKDATKKAQITARKCYGWNEKGHKVDRCPNKHKANRGRICYACRRKGHLGKDCPNSNSPKPNTFAYNNMLRKTTNGVSTSEVMCSPQTSTKAIWILNPIGPNNGWVHERS
jgi:hypothetical protein